MLDIRPGTTVRVYQRIQEKGKTRLQVFEGMVIARKHHTEPGATFTVRKVASGIGMERIFPLYSPMIEKIEIVKRSKVRQAKLYYIRDKAKKEVRRRMKQLSAEALEKRQDQEAEALTLGQEPEIVEPAETEADQATEAEETIATENEEKEPEIKEVNNSVTEQK